MLVAQYFRDPSCQITKVINVHKWWDLEVHMWTSLQDMHGNLKEELWRLHWNRPFFFGNFNSITFETKMSYYWECNLLLHDQTCLIKEGEHKFPICMCWIHSASSIISPMFDQCLVWWWSKSMLKQNWIISSIFIYYSTFNRWTQLRGHVCSQLKHQQTCTSANPNPIRRRSDFCSNFWWCFTIDVTNASQP